MEKHTEMNTFLNIDNYDIVKNDKVNLQGFKRDFISSENK